MRYTVHYADSLRMSSDGRRAGRFVPTLEEFDLYYRYVGTFEASSPDEVFRLLQDGGGGLGAPTIQRYVLRQVHHTSLSNGDIAIELDSGKAWLLEPRGWNQVELK